MTALIICALVAAAAGVATGSMLGYIKGYRDGLAKATEIWRESINAGADLALGEPVHAVGPKANALVPSA